MIKELEQLYKLNPLYRDLFPQQLEFVLAPSRFVAALCSRRAGKTEGTLIKCLQELSNHNGTMGLYLALTDKSVNKIVLPIARKLIAKHKLKASIVGEDIIFENGSSLSIHGANHVNKIEGFRGTKLLFCVVDEAASFNENILQYLIDEIIGPALSDLQGQLMLIGTPAAHCQGMFYDVTTGKEGSDVWIVKRWTAFDNPFMSENFAKDAELFCKRKKCDRTHPKFRREYLGDWCADDEALMIRPFALVHPPSVYSQDNWRSVIGVDFGFNDETAFSIIGWERNNPKSYVLECFGFTGADVAKLSAEAVAQGKDPIGMVTYIGNTLKRLKETYKPVKIVGDPAGASKIMVSEFLSKHKIVMDPAQKTDKKHYIEIFNDALVNTDLVINPLNTEELQKEMKKVVWNEDHTRELEGMKCDRLDATIYAYREALAYIEKIPVKGTQTEKDLTDQMFRKQLEQDMQRANDKLGDTFFSDMSQFLD